MAKYCPMCSKGRLERGSKLVTSTYRGHSITYEQSGEWCDICGEGLLTGVDVLSTQAQLLAWRAQIDNAQEND